MASCSSTWQCRSVGMVRRPTLRYLGTQSQQPTPGLGCGARVGSHQSMSKPACTWMAECCLTYETFRGNRLIQIHGGVLPEVSSVYGQSKPTNWEWKDHGVQNTLIGFDVNSEHLAVKLHEAKVEGAMLLSGNLNHLYPPRAIELQTLRKLRGQMAHFRASNSMWKMPIGPAAILIRYTDEKTICINCPADEVWAAFRIAHRLYSF